MIAASEWEIGWDGACARPTAVRMSLDIECRVTDKIEMELPTVSRGCCWCVGCVGGWGCPTMGSYQFNTDVGGPTL